MLNEWKTYVIDIDAYCARLQEAVSEIVSHKTGLTPNWCASFLVAIVCRWKLAFARTEVTVAKHTLVDSGDVWVGVINTGLVTCRYDLWLDGIHRTFSLRAGESQLLLDTNAIPRICLQSPGERCLYATSPHYEIVRCFISDYYGNCRRTLAQNGWTVDGVCGEALTASHIALPGMEEPWQEKAARKREADASVMPPIAPVADMMSSLRCCVSNDLVC